MSLPKDGFVKCAIYQWILACCCDSGNRFHFQALFLQHKILYTIKKRWDQIFWYRYRVFVFPNYGKFWSHSSKVPIWNYKVSTMLCCCTILLLTTANGKTKKAACVCGNWFGTKNGAQTLVGGFLQEIRAESRLICYCTSWQRTPILVGATPAEAVYQAKAQDGGIGKVFPKLRFVYTKAIQLHKVCVNAPPRYWSGQRHNHHSS